MITLLPVWFLQMNADTDIKDFPGSISGKEHFCQCGRLREAIQPLGWEDLLEEEMAAHSSIVAWEIPRTEEPGGLQSMGPKDSDMT